MLDPCLLSTAGKSLRELRQKVRDGKNNDFVTYSDCKTLEIYQKIESYTES